MFVLLKRLFVLYDRSGFTGTVLFECHIGKVVCFCLTGPGLQVLYCLSAPVLFEFHIGKVGLTTHSSYRDPATGNEG